MSAYLSDLLDFRRTIGSHRIDDWFACMYIMNVVRVVVLRLGVDARPTTLLCRKTIFSKSKEMETHPAHLEINVAEFL